MSSSPPTPCLFIASCQACPDNNGVFKRIKRDPEVYSEHILENNELKQNCFAHFFLGSLDPHERKFHEGVVSKPSRNRSFPFLLPSFLLPSLLFFSSLPSWIYLEFSLFSVVKYKEMFPSNMTGRVHSRTGSQRHVQTQSCQTLCDPMGCSPPGSSVHGISQGRNTGVGCHFILQGMFLTQGLNPHLHWQADSLPLAPPGKLGAKENGLKWLQMSNSFTGESYVSILSS